MSSEHQHQDPNTARTSQSPAWRYDEMKHCGVDYGNDALANDYDTHHESFRDYRREAEQIVTQFGLDRSATVLDMGCGTGAFALHAAGYYETIHAVDVSRAMLACARRKVEEAGIKNVQFHQGGFLTYEHEAEPVDAINTSVALHHLPDFWKLVALTRLAAILKPGGRLRLFDVVFSFDVRNHEACFNQFVLAMGEQMGPGGQAEAETHLRDEYSTCDWVMEGMLERSGFRIDTKEYHDGFLATYLCTKKDQQP